MSEVRSRVSKNPADNIEELSNMTEAQRKVLHFYHELEEWQKDNHYIRSGYVRGTNSYQDSLKSLLYVHNETGNIYSHLVPATVVIGALLYYLKYELPIYNDHLKFWEWLNFLQFGFAATFCLGMSSIFHCMKSHSHKVSRFGNQLDYFGIIILITCSLISIILFAYHDNLRTKLSFCVIFLTLGGLCTFFTLDPKFSSSVYRPIRSGMFILFGLSGTLPVLVALNEFGYQETKVKAGLDWLILEGVFYIAGALLYAARVPERFTHLEQDESSLLSKPHAGRFDIWGHSHQIFHVLVVVAAFCHWKALLQCYHAMHLSL